MDRHFRGWDFLPIASALALVVWSRSAGTVLPDSHAALVAWLTLAAAWLVSVAGPLFLDRSPRSGAALLVLFSLVLLANPSIRPAAAVVVALLWLLSAIFGRGKERFAPAEVLFRFSPILMTALVYVSLRWLLPLGDGETYDRALIGIDERLFGGNWSVAAERIQNPLLTEWLSFHYGIYLAYPVIAAILLYVRRADAEFADLSNAFNLAMYAGFVGYLAVPARGPFVGLADHYAFATLPGGAITHAVRSIIADYGYGYDVFPSLHVANAILCVRAIRREMPRVFPLAAFFAANLIAATIYLRMHYTIDVVAGVALAAVVVKALPFVRGRPAQAGAPQRMPGRGA